MSDPCKDCDIPECPSPCETLLQAADADLQEGLMVGVVIDTEEKFAALMRMLGLPNTGKVHPLKVVPMKDGMTSIPLSKEDVEGYKKLSEEAKVMRGQEVERNCRNCDKVQRNGFGGLVLTDEGQGQCYYGGYSEVELDKHRTNKDCNAWGEFIKHGKLAKDTTRTRADKPESETR